MINRIINNDCLSILDLIESESVDMILTDPPYFKDFQSNSRKEKFEKIDMDIKNKDNMMYVAKCILQMHRILKDNSSAYIFCDWESIDFFKPVFESCFALKNIIIWRKNNWGMGDLKGAYAHQYEMILYGHKGRDLLRRDRFRDVIDFDRVNNQKQIHPNEKPVDLLEFLILNSSDENDIIFDGFAGSGSTCVAAKNTNRNFIGVESKEEYYNIAVNRINNTAYQMRFA